MTIFKRVSRGVPTGGQFAASARDEAAVSLDPDLAEFDAYEDALYAGMRDALARHDLATEQAKPRLLRRSQRLAALTETAEATAHTFSDAQSRLEDATAAYGAARPDDPAGAAKFDRSIAARHVQVARRVTIEAQNSLRRAPGREKARAQRALDAANDALVRARNAEVAADRRRRRALDAAHDQASTGDDS